jgi:asparagine synthase (glutamine-hydrolysing)
MPGIVGLISDMPRERAEAELQRMVEELRHESFYSTGTWVDEPAGVYVGWCLRKGSLSGRMPLRNGRGDVVLVFSGEDFSEPGVGGAAESYLVDRYADDRSFPAGLNGRFHGIAIDRARRTAKLFNDRYGMNRIYYHEAPGTFYFAAEAKAILAVRPELRSLNLQALGELLSCGCVLENRTLFEGIHVLPGAASWTFEGRLPVKKASYFEPREWENQTQEDPETYYRGLRDAFSKNLPRYFEGPERLGMSLTGGLDTRMVMAWHKAPKNSLPCYTFGGMFRECRDVRVARQVAGICEQQHEVIRVDQAFLDRFAHYAERTVYLTDGCADVSRAPDLYVNELARQIAPVRMTGNYGGEVLRQVRAFKPVKPLPGLYQPELLSSLDQAEKTYREMIRVHPLSFAVFKQAPWHHYGLYALEQTQLSVRSPYLDNDFVRTIFRAPAAAGTSDGVCQRLIGDASPALQRLPTDIGVGSGGGRLWGSIRRSLLKFEFKAEYGYDYGMPQAAVPFDRLISGLHPERLFLGRHKFYHYRVWYRSYLSKFVRELLLDPKTLSRPHIDRKTVETIVNSHLKGMRNYTLEIHKLLTVELMMRTLLDPAPVPVRVPVAGR